MLQLSIDFVTTKCHLPAMCRFARDRRVSIFKLSISTVDLPTESAVNHMCDWLCSDRCLVEHFSVKCRGTKAFDWLNSIMGKRTVPIPRLASIEVEDEGLHRGALD